MTFVTYVNPAIAIMLGAVVLGEPLTVGLLIGFPLVIVGSVLGTWRNSPPPPEATGVADDLRVRDGPGVSAGGPHPAACEDRL